MGKTALVTGGNRGIGREVCRILAGLGHRVILTSRREPLGSRAAAELASSGLAVSFLSMDVADRDSVGRCAANLASQGVDVDILVNNAGVFPQGGVLSAVAEDFEEAMAVNFFGALWTCRAFLPGMLARGFGRVVNVSSGYGSIGEGLEGPAPYSLSKAALNALTLKLAQEVRGDVKINAVCPGWVRTRMGGAGAELSAAEGADTIVWLALLPPDGPSGGYFRNREPIPW